MSELYQPYKSEIVPALMDRFQYEWLWKYLNRLRYGQHGRR